MGYIETRPNGRVRGVFRHPVTGRRISETFEFAYEAEGWVVVAEQRAKAAAALAEAPGVEPGLLEPGPDLATTVKQNTTTVAAHAEALIDRRTLADATERGYRTHRRGLIATGMGDRQLATLKRSEVEAWVTKQAKAGVGRSTINARLKLLRMVTADAKAELIIDHDPGAGVDYLTTDMRADRIVSRGEETRLLVACEAPLDVAVLAALDAGLRWSEVYGLAVDSINGRYITVRQINERTTRKIRRYPKGHRERVVPMTERLADALAPVVAEARARGGAEALLFVSATGGVVNYESWRRLRWDAARDRAGLAAPRPGFHSLRHTYGSRLAAAGVPRSEIAKLMGHADEETTARYIHAGDDGRRLELVEAALGAATAGHAVGAGA